MIGEARQDFSMELGPVPTPLERSKARAALLHSIIGRLRAGQAEEALACCVEALVDDPADATLNGLAAVAAADAHQYEAAVQHAQRSLRVRDSHGPTLLVLGRALRGLRQHREAAAAFDAAVQADPDAPAQNFLLCASLLQEGNPRAVDLLDGLLSRFPNFAGGWEDLGHVLVDLGKSGAALTCFAKAMQVAPTSMLAMRRGVILKDLGRLREAAAAFRQAAELDPKAVRSRFLLGLCLQDSGDRAGAAEAYREALAIDPTLAEAAVNLGTVLQDEGDLVDAKRAYGQALQVRPDSFGRIAQAMTTSRRGELWLDLGKLRRTLAE